MRRPKPATSVWLIEERNKAKMKPLDVAEAIDVAESTVRGWEAGRSIKSDNRRALERLFGVEAPAESVPPEDLRDLIAVLSALVDELRAGRLAQEHRNTGFPAIPRSSSNTP